MNARSLPGLLTLCSALSGLFPGIAARAATPDFNRDVRPILSDKCFYCHGPDEEKRKGKLRLDTPEGAAKAIDKAHPEKSEILSRIFSKDPDELMPPPDGNIGKSLTSAEKAVLQEWIKNGAPYAKHWSFVAPSRPALPRGPMHPIDALVRARLAQEKLQPQPEASREMLIRRLSFDLTGLPPKAEDVRAFVQDSSPGAYEKLVDRILASPHFGERMALVWMDLGRYGDSSVYHADGPREMWGWRDWVIEAFNQNMPFNQFTIEQLAGDLLPEATLSQKIASGFNRNHATTDEGGVIAEEFRVDYVVDRVKTTSNVWLGLSLECAQCHDHKYDPISQTDYYRFYAYFNNTRDNGMQTRNGNSAPMVEIPDPEAADKQAAARKAVQEARDALKRAETALENTKPFRAWSQPAKAPAADNFPTADVVFHVPATEPDKATLLSSLQGFYANATASPLVRADRHGKGALSFNGRPGLVFEEGGPRLDGTQAFSFAAWVRFPDKSGSGPLLSRLDKESSPNGFEFAFEKGAPALRLLQSGAKKGIEVIGKNPVEPGAWHHVVVTYDGSRKAAGVKIFVDSEPQPLNAKLDALENPSSVSAPLVLAGRLEGARFKGETSAITVWNRTLSGGEIAAARGEYVDALRLIPAELRSPEHTKTLARAYALFEDKGSAGLRNNLAKAWDAEVKTRRGVSSVMTMEDLPANQMRETFVLSRGQYDAPLKDKPVKAGVPVVLPALPEDAPPTRLALAQWLVSPAHPLTARVQVNRLWQMLFGEGLVRTSEDFGLQGEMPSHPELLDWLACEFVESGWNVKGLLRQILLSQTYRQDSRLSAQAREKDPENRLLSRGARFRLQAEFVRDNALAVSGLLNRKLGGPSVKPYQPPGIWEEVALDTRLSKFSADSGDKLYRRSLYTYWKRSSPHPSLTTFDATTREKCTGRRSRTNTPLQALVTLNDPQFVEAARHFAQRLLLEGGKSPAERAAYAIRQALGREPRAREVPLLTRLAAEESERFRARPEEAKKLLSIGESPRLPSLPADEHAAWTVVANTILNLDDFLVKP